jgi:hypothetical protein
LSIATLRLMASEFEIRSDASGVLARLEAEAPQARQCHAIQARHCWNVTADAGGYYRLTEEDGRETTELSAAALQRSLLRRMSELALAALPHHSFVRAAIGHHAGHSFLLVGGRGSGKSSLATSLLLAGVSVSGDNLVLIRDGFAMAYPRRFMLWETSLPLLPALPPYTAPRLTRGSAAELQVPLDPSDLGGDWLIQPEPIDAVFCLDPNFGGRSLLRPCGTLEAAQRVLPNCSAPKARDPLWISRLCAMLGQAHTAVLTLGTLDSAIRWIRIALDRLPPARKPPQ